LSILDETYGNVPRAESINAGRKTVLKALTGLLLTATCLYLAFRGLEFGEVMHSLGRASYKAAPVYLALLFAFFWLKALRWKLLLLPLCRFQTTDVIPSMMIGFMGNNVLPAHLGEVVRVVMLSRRSSLSKTAVFSTIMLERLMDMMVVLLFLVVGARMAGNRLPDWVGSGGLILGAGCLALLLGAGLVGFFPRPFLRGAMKVFERVPERLSSKVLGSVTSVTQALELARNPKVLLAVVSISILKWALMAGMVYISLESFRLHLPFWVSFLVVGVCAVAVTVPSAPGFFGVIQLGFWVGLQFLGVEKADAIASSVYYHLGQYIPVTAAGLYYLNRQGISLGQVRNLTD